MTAAPILPERREWTVDDLCVRLLLAVEVVSQTSTFRDMYDKAKVHAHAGVRSYWVVDPLQDRVALTEYALGANRQYDQVANTEDLFVTETRWKVSVDLPALAARRDALLAAGDD